MSDNRLKFFKVNVLPEQADRQPNAMYLLKNGDNLEIHLTNKDGSTTASTLSEGYINNLIVTESLVTVGVAATYTDKVGGETLDSAKEYADQIGTDTLAEAKKYTDEVFDQFSPPNSVVVVESYGALDPKNKSFHNCFILVRDASDDPTVNTGSATYVFDVRDNEFVKVAEHESMDLELEWKSIKDRPKSSPTDIDEAVKNSKHENINVLNALTESNDGQLMYNGNAVSTDVILHSVEW